MTTADDFRQAFTSIDVNGDFSAATVSFTDGSRLAFVHRVGERTAGSGDHDDEGSASRRLLAAIRLFRLNGKHLDILFQDGSRWEAPFR